MENADYFKQEQVSLKGKTALVTGASSGIGFASACALAQEGVNLFLVARREKELEKLKTLIAEHCPQVSAEYRAIDLREEESFKKLKEQHFFNVNILINNAGLVRGLESVGEGKWEEWQEMWQVNVEAAFRMVREVLPFLEQKKSGDIISVASIAAHVAYENGAVYCATKSALHAFCTSLRKELAGTDIRSTIVSPGMVETEFSVVRFRGDKNKAKSVYQGMRPLQAQDVAAQIIWALKQPRHVCLDEILVMAQDQAGTKKIVKN